MICDHEMLQRFIKYIDVPRLAISCMVHHGSILKKPNPPSAGHQPGWLRGEQPVGRTVEDGGFRG